MADDPKLAAYLSKAREVAAASPTSAEIQGMKDRHEGCRKQFAEVSAKLQEAVEAKDSNAVKQHEDLLRENFRLRKSLAGKLRAVGKPVVDPAVE